MPASKPIIKSKTIIANVVLLVLSQLAESQGLDIPAEWQTAIAVGVNVVLRHVTSMAVRWPWQSE